MASMDAVEKARILGGAAQYDICSSPLCKGDKTGGSRVQGPFGRWIYPAVVPDGRIVRLFKVLMTNACANDCLYCANTCSRVFRRHKFGADELARVFMELNRRRMAEGLFLSSAIAKDGASGMDEMIKAVEILRLRHRFSGYMHLKILPGARFDQVERAIELADRVSINLEAPNADRLGKISSGKEFDELVLRMKWVGDVLARGEKVLPAGHTTQFVVGASEESDREVLHTTAKLYDRLGLRRAYFSAFQPVEGTALEDRSPTPFVREHRLYQADWLLRKYGFEFEELVFDEGGNLGLDKDPKEIWARRHPERFPVEVNRAAYEELLRVPGIGARSARRIVRQRGKERFHTVQEVRGTGVVLKRAEPYILIDGKAAGSLQLSLWDIEGRGAR